MSRPATHYASSDDGSFIKSHDRRPSNALSYTSTIPEGTTARQSPSDMEKGAPSDIDDDDAPVKPRKLLGFIPLPKKKEIIPFKFPDPKPEEMGEFDRNLLPSALYNIFDPKSYDALRALGGTSAILKGLKTDPKQGLSDSSGVPLSERTRIYGENRVPQKPSKSFLALCWAAYTVSKHCTHSSSSKLILIRRSASRIRS